MDHEHSSNHSRVSIMLVAGWSFLLILYFVIVGYWATLEIYRAKIRSIERHAERMNPLLAEKGRTKAEVKALPASVQVGPAKVLTGIYVDRIVEISTKATSWTVDFYIWFNWTGSKLDPGKTFQVVEGEILNPVGEPLKSYSNEGDNYELYRVTAKITKFFDVTRYPRDDHLLVIRIEDSKHQLHELRYIPDIAASSVSTRVAIPGYRICKKNIEIITKPHSYRTNRGDPNLPPDYKATYSQLVYGIPINRPDWGLYVKMFQGLFSAVLISMLAFLVLPIDKPRFALGIGAFFAAVAATYITKSQLPGVGIVTLSDVINGIGLTTIFLTLLSSIIALYLYGRKNQKKLSRTMDKLSLIIILIGYLAVNISIAVAASYKC